MPFPGDVACMEIASLQPVLCHRLDLGGMTQLLRQARFSLSNHYDIAWPEDSLHRVCPISSVCSLIFLYDLCLLCFDEVWHMSTLIARFMGRTWGPPGADRTQVGPMLAPWTLLSGLVYTYPLWLLYMTADVPVNLHEATLKYMDKYITWIHNQLMITPQ